MERGDQHRWHRCVDRWYAHAQRGASVAPASGGSGTLEVTGGALALAGSVTVTDVVVAGGTLAGTGTLAAGSQVTWSSGTIVGSITNDGSLTVTNGGTETLTGTLTNAGSIVVDTGVYGLPGQHVLGRLDHQSGRRDLRPPGHRRPQQHLH